MRYAIYFMPDSKTPLWHFGSEVLGYDAQTGNNQPRSGPLQTLPLDVWTSEPQRYGFHATLKAPFYLAPQYTENDLLNFARIFAQRRGSFVEPALQLTRIWRFIALTLSQPSILVNALADDAVIEFDHFRAPMTDHDFKRQSRPGMSERQMQNLQRWGYPLVLQDFTFHMTLSNALETEQQAQLFEALAGAYRPLAASVKFDALAVFVQPAPDQRFHVLERMAFNGH